MADEKLIVRVQADISDLKKGMDDVQNELKGATKEAESVSKTLSGVGKAIAAAFTIGAVVGFTKNVIETTAQIQAMDAQFEQIFKGTEGEQALARISTQADELGINVDRLKGSYSSFGAQLKGAGMEGAAALEATALATSLAADSAAFYDTNLETASASIASFMKGNFEAGDAIGVFTNAKQMDVAANATYGKSWADLTESERQWLLLDTVQKTYDQSGATGQAAREQDSWANSTANSKAEWDRLLATVGKPVLEVATGIMKGLSDVIAAASEKVNEIKANWEAWEQPLTVIGILIGGLALGIGIYTLAQNAAAIATAVSTGATAAFGAAMAVVTSPIFLVVAAIAAAIAIGYLLVKNWDTIKETAANVWKGIKDTIGGAIDKIKGFLNFKWEFPKLKMPHFSISGKFSLAPPSIPKLDVSWYARGAIFKKPTMLGNGIGVGDASNGHGSSPEVVAPLSELKQMLGLGNNDSKAITINLNGSYSFRDKQDMDYLLNQMALATRRS